MIFTIGWTNLYLYCKYMIGCLLNMHLMLILIMICLGSVSYCYTNPVYVSKGGFGPWIVQLNNGLINCSGVIISDRHILTSAHCVNSFEKRKCLKVFFKNTKNPFSVKVVRYAKSPDFVTRENKRTRHDIAMLELEHNVNRGDVRFPFLDMEEYSFCELTKISTIYAAGYSGTDNVSIAQLDWFSSGLDYRLIYPGFSQRGDSGGPLFYFRDGEVYVLGLLFWSLFENGEKNYFEPLSNNYDFILNEKDWQIVECDIKTKQGLTLKYYAISIVAASSLSAGFVMAIINTLKRFSVID